MKASTLGLSIALALMVNNGYAADEKKADATPAAAKEESTKADTKKTADGKAADAKKEEKVELKADADPAIKTAIETATKANKAAADAGFEWFMSGKPVGDMLQDAIKLANDGKNEEALKIAQKVEKYGNAGVKQAEVAKTAAPHF